MKKCAVFLTAFFIMALALSCNNNSETAAGPPYTVQVEEFLNPDLPDLHSYTHAVYGDKIIMIGGRTNGLHGQTYSFVLWNSNKSIYVIDTKGWSDPKTWAVHQMPASDLHMPGAAINGDQFMANNAEFFTRDTVLYIIGGMLNSNVPTRLIDPKHPQTSGIEMVPNSKSIDGKIPNNMHTLNYMTAINLPSLVNTVMNKVAMPMNSMRQVQDSLFQLTGGEVGMIGDTVFLAFGWNFFASAQPFGDMYSHQVRRFTFKDDGKNLAINKIPLCPTCGDGHNGYDTLGEFRRRDGSMSVMIDPANGNPGLLFYSGVFKNGATNFDTPVWITKDSAAEKDFVMRSNVYTCQVVPVYSQSNKQFYATLLGGMKNANYTGDPFSGPVLLNSANAKLIPIDGNNPFDHIPFSNQFSTVMVDDKHVFSQYLLPDTFPGTKTAFILPASDTPQNNKYPRDTLKIGSAPNNGAEAEIIWTLNSSLMLPNGVVDYDAFIKANPKGGNIGYLHGGILSVLTNVFGGNAPHYSVASNRIFAIKIVPLAK